MNSVMGVEPRFRAVNLMSDAPEMRELRGMIERRVRASGYTGTEDDPVPIAVYTQVVEASIAEYNALLDARDGLYLAGKQ